MEILPVFILALRGKEKGTASLFLLLKAGKTDGKKTLQARKERG